MIRTVTLVACLVAGPALADFEPGTLTGDWTGGGNYTRGDSSGTLRCRLTIAPGDGGTVLSGRCAGAEGADDIGMLLTTSGGTWIAAPHGTEPDTTTRIRELTGTASGDALTLEATAPGESAALTIAPTDAGLRFASSRITRSGREDSFVVDFTRQ
ncbi:hypothetical protein [Pelagovum pacificum]|uniref:Alkaline proteinase inhibitor/ Outer membrane lipoprotein Omp19 domain-containing protein n=1 Tax=Pelagovum pacificum TaxID=2588711 RepID=A0A5C5GEC3_9RHOB|nr:hypothetical protein [Pelagovum pacificum]QQA44011.1 hypothetical protein I8N54_05385 [Pelagovum pacificum]TNY32860.1 hypothetical protein FHY64_06175 [Pelagovum pacificum]